MAKQNMVRNSEVFLFMMVVIMVMMVIIMMISGDRKGRWPGKGLNITSQHSLEEELKLLAKIFLMSMTQDQSGRCTLEA